MNPVCGSSLTAAANVRGIREGLGWSQYRLAEETGMSKGMINFLEAGLRNFTLPTLERVAGALGTTAARLLTAPRDGGEGG